MTRAKTCAFILLSTASCVVQLNIYKYVCMAKKKKGRPTNQSKYHTLGQGARVCLEGMHTALAYCWEVHMYNTYIYTL